MKFRRFLSGLLFGIGCAMIFIGITAAVLPSIPNVQLQLVLGSFSLASGNVLVRLINRAMSYALAQSWHVLLFGILAAAAGAWLLLYFTPKKPNPVPVQKENPTVPPSPAEPEPIIPSAVETPNPFAVGTYLDHLPLRRERNTAAFTGYQTPILEPNRITDQAAPVVPAAFETRETEDLSEPFYSSRFEAESKAIEAERSIPSQSGSSMLIRSAFDEAQSPKEEAPSVAVQDPRQEPVPVKPASPLATASNLPVFSPRIRSTMGRRSSR